MGFILVDKKLGKASYYTTKVDLGGVLGVSARTILSWQRKGTKKKLKDYDVYSGCDIIRNKGKVRN